MEKNKKMSSLQKAENNWLKSMKHDKSSGLQQKMKVVKVYCGFTFR